MTLPGGSDSEQHGWTLEARWCEECGWQDVAIEGPGLEDETVEVVRAHRAESVAARTIDLFNDGEDWSCRAYMGMHSGDFGEGRGRNIAEAIEAALDDLEAQRTKETA